MCVFCCSCFEQQVESVNPHAVLSRGPLENPGGVFHKSQGVSHKPHSAADMRSDSLRFVEFASSVAAVSHSKWKVLIRMPSCSSRGLWKSRGVSHKPQGVSHKPHFAADMRTDLFCFVELASSVAAALRNKWTVLICTLSWSPGAS